jgi:hypothetical protein
MPLAPEFHIFSPLGELFLRPSGILQEDGIPADSRLKRTLQLHGFDAWQSNVPIAAHPIPKGQFWKINNC